MKTLFVEKSDMELRYERACLLIYQEGKRVGSVPLVQLERIVVSPQVALTAGVLGVVAEKGVALLVLNNRYPERTALLVASTPGDAHRRVQQYQRHLDPAFRLHWSNEIVRLKIYRQYRLLARLRHQRPDLRLALSHGMQSLQTLLASLMSGADDLASLRGKEGAAAAAYFQAFTQVFAPALGFNNRNRRPPLDPVNACLSLSYTLFYQEAVNALKISGLDPALGCYHELYGQRDSLACDILEPIRPLIDAWVYRLFQGHLLRREDFNFANDACLLHASGKTRFYEAFRGCVPAYRRLLRRYAQLAADVVCQPEHACG